MDVDLQVRQVAGVGVAGYNGTFKITLLASPKFTL
jgi:ABC-type polysaccharide/polyol phosphate transport system ATPase subunit